MQEQETDKTADFSYLSLGFFQGSILSPSISGSTSKKKNCASSFSLMKNRILNWMKTWDSNPLNSKSKITKKNRRFNLNLKVHKENKYILYHFISNYI